MPQNTPRLENNTFYHIYNRGNNKENIFIENENYYYFLKLWKKHINPIADTYVYCLLKNHFHFLVKIKEVDENRESLSRMNKAEQQFSNLFNAYTKAFNKQHERTGKLFQNRFSRKKVESEKYIKQLIYYIHSNPQHHGFAYDFRDYAHSSYQSLLSTGKTSLKRTEIFDFFDSKENFLLYHNELHTNLLENELLKDLD